MNFCKLLVICTNFSSLSLFFPLLGRGTSVEIITVDDKIFGVKTAVLEEKATACNMLCCYADELKEGFYPWIEQVDNAVLSDAYFTCLY